MNASRSCSIDSAAHAAYNGVIMARMTDEEADALDEYYTQNTIMPDPGKPGFFARHKEMFVGLDPATAAYLRARAEATHKTPAQIISELVRKELASA